MARPSESLMRCRGAAVGSRVVQSPDRWKPESTAVGRVTFCPDDRHLVAQTGFLNHRRCAPETVHVVDHGSGEVRTAAILQKNCPA